MQDPACKYFGICGGCSSQNLDYQTQLKNKEQTIRNLILKDHPNLLLKIFSGKEYGYRNRMDFLFHPKGLGLRKKGDWRNIVDIDNCLISDEKINKILGEIRDFFNSPDSFEPEKAKGALWYVIIRATQLGCGVCFVLNEDSSRLGAAVDKIKEYAKKSMASSILILYSKYNRDSQDKELNYEEYAQMKGDTMLKESLNGKIFSFPAFSFFQNNTLVAEKMLLYTEELLKSQGTSNATLLDLYGGVGTFGISNAKSFGKAVVVENVKESIECAKTNLSDNGIKNAEAIVLDSKHIDRLNIKPPCFVITDPPRSGMDEKTILNLKRLNPQAIIYVSCNLAQLAKDIQKFKDYEIKNVALFDLFPQTPHVETIVMLSRNKQSKT